MEFHERMAIAHSLHTFWNPVSEEVVDELLWALDLAPGARVLDIACGRRLFVVDHARNPCRGNSLAAHAPQGLLARPTTYIISD